LIDSSNTGKRLKATFENSLSGLRDEDFDRHVEFAISDGPKQAMRLGQLMHQAANHGTHHRGQIAWRATQRACTIDINCSDPALTLLKAQALSRHT
jgi:uncharacterized damage-inducible protein DinB